jgi:periplasmic divalent cation tolerance protein
MKPATKFAVVLVTAPDLKTARALAKAALKARLIACANLVSKIESHYWWHGKIESGAEVLLVLKTTK